MEEVGYKKGYSLFGSIFGIVIMVIITLRLVYEYFNPDQYSHNTQAITLIGGIILFALTLYVIYVIIDNSNQPQLLIAIDQNNVICYRHNGKDVIPVESILNIEERNYRSRGGKLSSGVIYIKTGTERYTVKYVAKVDSVCYRLNMLLKKTDEKDLYKEDLY